jgi:hypothetical protein
LAYYFPRKLVPQSVITRIKKKLLAAKTRDSCRVTAQSRC